MITHFQHLFFMSKLNLNIVIHKFTHLYKKPNLSKQEYRKMKRQKLNIIPNERRVRNLNAMKSDSLLGSIKDSLQLGVKVVETVVRAPITFSSSIT
jgi:hypothetical protein